MWVVELVGEQVAGDESSAVLFKYWHLMAAMAKSLYTVRVGLYHTGGGFQKCLHVIERVKPWIKIGKLDSIELQASAVMPCALIVPECTMSDLIYVQVTTVLVRLSP